MTDVNPANNQTQTSAVSIFDQGNTANDFPVLKAFQEYIDAEQAKARKRMLGLSIFFVVLLIVVVITFVFVLSAVITRNQVLSDKILDIALRERAVQQQPVVNVTPQPVTPPQQNNDMAIKPVLEKLENLASAIAKSQQPAPTVQQPAPPPAQPIQPQPAESAESLRLKEQLRIQEAKLKEAEEKLKEQQRQAEIEKHRRRLYPEYYAKQEAAKQKAALDREAQELAKKSAAEKAKHDAKHVEKAVTLKPIDYFAQNDEEDEDLQALLKRKPRAKSNTKKKEVKQKKQLKPKVKVSKPTKTETPKASKPVQKEAPKSKEEIRKPVKTETLKIETGEGNSMPWLIESSDLN